MLHSVSYLAASLNETKKYRITFAASLMVSLTSDCKTCENYMNRLTLCNACLCT